MSYELRNRIRGEWIPWSRHLPTDEIKSLLDHRPDARVLLNDGQTEWRKAPRDTDLLYAIEDSITGCSGGSFEKATRVYEMLEREGVL